MNFVLLKIIAVAMVLIVSHVKGGAGFCDVTGGIGTCSGGPCLSC